MVQGKKETGRVLFRDTRPVPETLTLLRVKGRVILQGVILQSHPMPSGIRLQDPPAQGGVILRVRLSPRFAKGTQPGGPVIVSRAGVRVGVRPAHQEAKAFSHRRRGEFSRETGCYVDAALGATSRFAKECGLSTVPKKPLKPSGRPATPKRPDARGSRLGTDDEFQDTGIPASTVRIPVGSPRYAPQSVGKGPGTVPNLIDYDMTAVRRSYASLKLRLANAKEDADTAAQSDLESQEAVARGKANAYSYAVEQFLEIFGPGLEES